MGKMTVPTVGSFHVFVEKWLEYCVLHGNLTFSGKTTFSNFLLIDLILLAYDSHFPQGLFSGQKTRPQDFLTCPFFQKAVLGQFWVITTFGRSMSFPQGLFSGQKNTPPGFFDMSLFPKGRFRSVLGHFGV